MSRFALLWLVALAALPCIAAQSSGFLKPDRAPALSVLQGSPKQTELSQEQDKLAKLQKQLDQQKETVATQQKAADKLEKEAKAAEAEAAEAKAALATGPGAAKEREAGKRAVEELEQQHKLQHQQAKRQADAYETIMKRAFSQNDPKIQKKLDKKIAENREDYTKALKEKQELDKHLLKKRIECMQTIPGDQSGYEKMLKKHASTNPDKNNVCRSEEERYEIARQYEEQKVVAECVQPTAEEAAKERFNEQLADAKLSKQQQEYFAKQHQMRQQMKEKQMEAHQESQDRLMKKRFECMHKVCDEKVAKESEADRRQRTMKEYQECTDDLVPNEIGRMLKNMLQPKKVAKEQKQVEQKAEEEVVEKHKPKDQTEVAKQLSGPKPKTTVQESGGAASGSKTETTVTKTEVLHTETKVVKVDK